MITDVTVKGSSWIPISKMIDTPLNVEAAITVSDKADSRNQVVYRTTDGEGNIVFLYTYATVALRSSGLVQAMCPCVLTFHKTEGYFTLEIEPAPDCPF